MASLSHGRDINKGLDDTILRRVEYKQCGQNNDPVRCIVNVHKCVWLRA